MRAPTASLCPVGSPGRPRWKQACYGNCLSCAPMTGCFWTKTIPTRSSAQSSSSRPAAAPRAERSWSGAMSDLFEQAKAYYESAASDPWRWTEEAKVLVWADGTTVAFREELAEIIDG